MKPILILLPGWGGSRETWKDFITDAEQHFQVICIDLPCFGTEPCPSIVWGVEEYADFVIKKIRSHSDTPVILMGHSFGGQVAAYIAATHKEYVEKLILSGAAAIRPKKLFRRAFFSVLTKCGKLVFSLPGGKRIGVFAKKLFYRSIGSPDYEKTDGIKRSIFQKIIRQDLSSLLPRITAPTLILWGKHDSYVSIALGKKIHASIPQSEMYVIDKGKHGLHLTHREEILASIEAFVFEHDTTI